MRVAAWEKWLFVCLDKNADPLEEFLGSLYHQLKPFNLDNLKFHKRVTYELDCNWKVFVDNYLDGGYHVPVLHKGLNSALQYKHYRVTTKDRHCLQDCPTSKKQDDISTFETETDGYTLVDASITYDIPLGDIDLSVYLSGENLTDEEARVHTSFLKDIAPRPGRNFAFGVRGYF